MDVVALRTTQESCLIFPFILDRRSNCSVLNYDEKLDTGRRPEFVAVYYVVSMKYCCSSDNRLITVDCSRDTPWQTRFHPVTSQS